MDRHQLNIITESAIVFARGKRINKFSRVGVVGVRGWLTVEDKAPGLALVTIENEKTWINVKYICRIDILHKRIRTLKNERINR